MTEKLLRVEDLSTHFFTSSGIIKAVDSISFDISKGEIFGLVGESGSGKSVTALSIMRLVPDPPGKIVGGKIWNSGEDLLVKSENEMRAVRGREIGMIFQDPLSSLNPLIKIGDQIAQTVMIRRNLAGNEVKRRSIELLRLVGISDADVRANQYPFQLSGGMRQRVMIAIALAAEPKLLIADEATTNLDVTIQAQILELLKDIRKERGVAILLITHNLGIVASMCDRVAVMYGGQILETVDTENLFRRPLHPYTEALLRAVPESQVFRRRLEVIEGDIPNPLHLPSGCRFHPRCKYAKQVCTLENPELIKVTDEHYARCLKYKYANW